MFSAKPAAKDGPLTVHVPSPEEDRPSWIKVGLIAAIGFLIGVAWPRLAGVRLGPSAPETASTSAVPPATSAEPPPVASVSSMPAAPAVHAAASAPIAAIEPAPPTPEPTAARLTVGHGFVFSCKSADGESLRGTDCGKLPGLDGVVMPRLRKLEACPAAATLSGKVHWVVRADFVRGGLTVEYGRSQGPDAPDALLACARTSLSGASVAGLPHNLPAYAVAYTIAFGSGLDASGGHSPSARTGTNASADGSSQAQQQEQQEQQVVWDVALVRDAPKTGKVIARLQRGTPLRLGSSKDGWYPVKFGDGFSSDGWIFRGAIGR